MATALPTQADLLAMLPSIAVLVAFIAVAGCCIYISYRVGQGVSPATRMLQQRMAELEAAFGRSEKDFRQSLERHRDATAKEAKRLLDDGVRSSEAQAQFMRRGLDDFGERINGLRLDFERDTTRVREAVQGAVANLREGAREDSRELARIQGETLASMSGQIGELGSDSARRQERAIASLEAIGSDLKAIHATSAHELRERMTADLAEFRAAVGQLGQTIAGHGAQLDGVEQTFRGALQEGAAKHDALNAAIEGKQDALNVAIASQFAKFRDEASGQLAQLLAVDERLEDSWAGLKDNFEAATRSLVQMGRAIDVLKNELTVKLDDGGGADGVDGLLQRVLQPTDYERDVEIEPGTNRRVAYAVKLSDNPVTRVWLPIGTLPVVQGYNEFVAATVYNDDVAIRKASEAFERAILAAADDLGSKFICPPRTLNLAVLLAATDDLFAEIARRDSLVDSVRRNCHVMIAGPATLPTLLTGLRMAFRGTSATRGVNLTNGPLGPTLLAEGD